jgi:hypothetical protein
MLIKCSYSLSFLFAFSLLGCSSFPKSEIKESKQEQNDVVISYETIDETIFINKSSWGVSANHNEIHVSSSGLGDEKIIIYSTELYYKKIGQDSLIIFANDSSIPKSIPRLNTFVKIGIKGIQSNKKYENIEFDWKDYGFEKVSVYDK